MSLFCIFGGMSRTCWVFLDGTSTKHYFRIKLLLPDWFMVSYMLDLECELFCLKTTAFSEYLSAYSFSSVADFVMINVLFY